MNETIKGVAMKFCTHTPDLTCNFCSTEESKHIINALTLLMETLDTLSNEDLEKLTEGFKPPERE